MNAADDQPGGARLGLEASLALLETLFAHESVGFALVDRDLRYVRLNERLAHINNLPLQDHLGRTVADVLGPEHWPVRREIFARALAGEPTVDAALPGKMTEPAGRAHHVLASYFPVRVEQAVVGVAIVVRDITAQVEAQEALRESEERYRRIVETTEEGVWTIDADSRTTFVNARMAQMLGHTPEEMLGRSLFDFMDDEGRQQAARNVERRRQGISEQHDFKFQRKDGSDIWVLIATNPFFDGGGNYAGSLGLFRDITEQRREAERQRTQLRDVLASVTEGKLRLCAGPEELPAPRTSFGGPIALCHREGLYALRHRVGAACAEARLAQERRYDLMTAAGEAGMNAIVHAAGGEATVSLSPDGTVQVRVQDQGTGITMEDLPRATLARGFSTKATLGHGLKMMLETADRLFLLTGPNGTTIVLEQERHAPRAAWLID